MTHIPGINQIKSAVEGIDRQSKRILEHLSILPKIHAELKLANDLKLLEIELNRNPAEIAMADKIQEDVRAAPLIEAREEATRRIESMRHRMDLDIW